MRTAIVIYFWVCAVLVLALSLGTELSKGAKRRSQERGKKSTAHIQTIRSHNPPVEPERAGKESGSLKRLA